MAGSLFISTNAAACGIELVGRVNFETVIPLRDYVSHLPDSVKEITVDLTDCLSMDSTCMGVLSMLALCGIQRKIRMRVLNAGGNRQLLKGLGVDKLFHFEEGKFERLATVVYPKEDSSKHDMRTAAETVLAAHETLMGADESNKQRFGAVVEMTKEDLKRLNPDEKK